MHHFYYHPQMDEYSAAVRRIPCLCQGCYNQLTIPWNLDITDWTKQDKFKRPTDCYFAPMMIDDDNDGNLNRWNFIKVESIPGEFEEGEVNAIEVDILQSHVNRVAEDIEKGGYGAINADEDDGYWLVQWSGDPYPIQREMEVEGCGKMPVGTLVCKGIYFNRIDRSPHWYQRQSPPTKYLFRVQQVGGSCRGGALCGRHMHA